MFHLSVRNFIGAVRAAALMLLLAGAAAVQAASSNSHGGGHHGGGHAGHAGHHHGPHGFYGFYGGAFYGGEPLFWDWPFYWDWPAYGDIYFLPGLGASEPPVPLLQPAPPSFYYCYEPPGYYPAISLCRQPWLRVPIPSPEAGAGAVL
jgi:hypothetical protein